MLENIDEKQLEEKIVEIRRVSKKTEGGNRFSFTAMVVVGDKAGSVGVGVGKAPNVRSAIEKGIKKAKKNLIEVPLKEGTIPFPVEVKRGAAHIVLRPRPAGSGVSVGGAVRIVAELAGIRDISGKILGTRNKPSNVYAMLQALRKLKELSLRYETAGGR